MTWLRQFDNKGHELASQASYSRRDGEEFSLNELRSLDLIKTEGLRSDETGPSTDVRFKLDYTRPFANESKFEAGYRTNLDNSTDNTSLSQYNSLSAQYVVLPEYPRSTTYKRTTHALFAIYGASIGNLGIQTGLRGEHTDSIVELNGASENSTINRWDIFPTMHTSYKLGGNRQLMASYTRRIDRPRGYYLEPFLTWTDAYNVRTGNPALKPEYIDSYEAGYSMPLGSTMFSTETYSRVSNNKIEQIRSAYDSNVTLSSVENVGADYALGVEFMVDTDLHKRWNLGLTGNLYEYRIEGRLYDQDFFRESFNWNTRLNNTF